MPTPFALAWDAVARHLRVEGEVGETDSAAFARALVDACATVPRPEHGGSLALDLDGLDLLDGVAVAEAINGLRAALALGAPVVLHRAPQMLAHTLYKIGMLTDGAISLEDPRVEEPTTAN